VASPTDVVARVNGVPILRQDLLRQMQSSQTQSGGVGGRTKGGDKRQQALQALIREELLAQEAARRGFAGHDAVWRTQRRALANLLLRTEFGQHFTKRSISQETLRAAYELNKLHFVRPRAVTVSHIVVMAGNKDPEDHHRQAHVAARQIHDIATSGRLSDDEFRQIAALIKKRHKGMQIKPETFTTPRRGVTVPIFADAAFALKRPGDISPVVQTSFGYHVIYLMEHVAARNISFEQAEDELRERVFEEARQMALERWLQRLEQRYHAKLLDLPGTRGP